MVVIVANDLPNAVRGKLKVWFLEIKPNVFVCALNNELSDRICEFVYEKCSDNAGLIIIKSKKTKPGYHIQTKGVPKRRLIEISGLQLISELP